MSRRELLRSQVRSAWEWTIENPYSQMLINSERGLQVYFCMKLMQLFEGANLDRRVFIEPTVVLPSGDRRYPDVLVCNSQRVIGVVELKYTPRATPETKKDFNTLAQLGIKGLDISVSNERFRGPEVPRLYSIADDAIVCWAAVHDEKIFAPDRSPLQGVGSRYLELRAVASESGVQIVETRGGDA